MRKQYPKQSILRRTEQEMVIEQNLSKSFTDSKAIDYSKQIQVE